MTSESGTGISISPNGLIAFEHLDLMDDLKNSYKSPKKEYLKQIRAFIRNALTRLFNE